ncbi:MAG: type II secretion system protein F [Candidatus Parcubacteria bacterium]|nr:MAG: type II secretion system protein F [Candidatus Parcubacteria bacterium]
MLVYRFKAYDNKGKIHKGNLFMPREEEVVAFLLRNNLTPIEVKPLLKTFLYRFFYKLFFRINLKTKLFLMRNFYVILKSGLGLESGLSILMKEAKGSAKDFLFYLSYNLQRGEPFYKTFSYFPQVFSSIEVETIKAGELSGNLANNLNKLAENLERQKQIKSEIISNMIYPVIIVILSFVVMFILFVFVMPRIGVLLTQLSSEPPFFTKIMINISNFINDNLLILGSIFLIFFLALVLVLMMRRTRAKLAKYLITLPLIYRFYLSYSLIQFLFILRSLLIAGLPLTQSLVLTAEAVPYYKLKEAILEIEKELKTGRKFGDALKKQDVIPMFLSSILAIASETGTLEDTLKVLEDFYLDEFRSSVKNVLNLIQPLLLVFIGLMVGVVALAVLVPIYQQISNQLQLRGH